MQTVFVGASSVVEPKRVRNSPSFSISQLASTYHFSCNKLIQLSGRKSNNNLKVSPDRITEAHFRRGELFELSLKNSLDNVIDCTNADPTNARLILQSAQPGQCLYQLPLKVPSVWYEQFNIGRKYKIRIFIPDFIFVNGTGQQRTLRIIDAKAAKGTTISHQFQVASYAYFLKYIIRNMRGMDVDISGGVWLPSDPQEPQLFRLDFLNLKIEQFYLKELPEILSEKPVTWLFNNKCRGCTFVEHCRSEAEGTPGQTPYMTEAKVEALLPTDIEDLAFRLSGLALNARSLWESLPYHFRIAHAHDAPVFMGNSTLKFPHSVTHELYISLLVDPVSQRMYTYSIQLYDSKKVAIDYFCTSKSIRMTNGVAEEKDCIQLAEMLAEDLVAILRWWHGTVMKLVMFLPTEYEKKCLQDVLIQCIAVDQPISGVARSAAKEVLLTMFSDGQLLTIDTDDIPEILDCSQAGPKIVIIEDIIRENVALPVYGFYRLQDMAYYMVKKHKHIMTDSEIYQKWESGQYINHDMKNRMKIYFKVVQRYKGLARNYQRHIEPGVNLFLLSPGEVRIARTRAFNSSYIGKLYFFKMFEAVTACEKKRKERFKGFEEDEEEKGGVHILFLGFEDVESPTLKTKSKAGRFAVIPRCDDDRPMDMLKVTTMLEYILVENSDEGALEAILFPDLKYRAQMQSLPLPAFDIYDIDPTNSTILMKGTFKRAYLTHGKHYRMYQRYIDFTVDKALQTLQAVDQRGEESIFVQLLKSPNLWAKQNVAHVIPKNLRSAALRLRDEFGMSPSQQLISNETMHRRLQIVWGPPGSGKTHFLALFVVWYLTYLADKSVRIGITAYTRAAVHNLLQRIAQVQRQRRGANFKLISMVRKVPKEPVEGMIYCQASSLNRHLGKGAVVIGGTVWDWSKVRQTWPSEAGCDIFIIDEASQLLVSDAAIGIEMLKQRDSRLIVAGDHMQLGPILQNEYPLLQKDQPLLFGSIQQCLMRRKDGRVCGSGDFFLGKGSRHDFGPSTIQLKDNWRMNDELNGFFQQIYGDDYLARYPDIHCAYLKEVWEDDSNEHVRQALASDKAITLVKVQEKRNQMLQTEARVVATIVKWHLRYRIDVGRPKPYAMIVTPHHRQRNAVLLWLKQEVNDGLVMVDTVEKMQGLECELVIACFTFLRAESESALDFLLDFRRWNVAVSRARCKVIVMTTDQMLLPRGMNVFSKKETSEGWGFVSLLEQWASQHQAVVHWQDDDDDSDEDYGGFDRETLAFLFHTGLL
ncbi:hypothetical protein K450DRAFT_246575 [Umbelopsis ramanniana AG]|uniref:DNA2/NAM7 helicase-like C-terminal domain-containing protein n=1 Tax=Umbelopsis ramanniana AG TaxID=1314678 RepID=A0AAD5EAD7_UMBRA|nr:uncharacterized protein K450DRAFT_246575 [Umbelopsis ramanniana AG]KAI8578590.1 hypothetical protein K450DRAFT_246575 [Umbelopsis ramanniana AG]